MSNRAAKSLVVAPSFSRPEVVAEDDIVGTLVASPPPRAGSLRLPQARAVQQDLLGAWPRPKLTGHVLVQIIFFIHFSFLLFFPARSAEVFCPATLVLALLIGSRLGVLAASRPSSSRGFTPSEETHSPPLYARSGCVCTCEGIVEPKSFAIRRSPASTSAAPTSAKPRAR